MDRYSGIGVFDSGVGGLTVASKIADILPNEKIVYFGDTAHVPYGDKTEEQITGYVLKIIEFLKKENVKALVMACNTSSAVVLPKLNGKVGVPVLGVIEFASRQAVKVSEGERIGVVANPVTVRSGAYVVSLGSISKNGVQVYQQACPRWVPLIEAGKLSGEEVEKVVREDLEYLVDSEVDTLILGCTHYPYLAEIIRRIMPDGTNIVNPAESLAYKLREILTTSNLLSDKKNPDHKFYVSGNPEEFKSKGSWFFGREIKRVFRVNIDEEKKCKDCLKKTLTFAPAT